jgi:curved DNA-binding protein CbpA
MGVDVLAAQCRLQVATVTQSRVRDLNGADPYAILGVDRTATDDTIVSAYGRLIRQAHPDLPTGDEEHAKLLHLARDILLDPTQRREYDRIAAGNVRCDELNLASAKAN